MSTFEDERKSIKDMTDEELREELRQIRKARRVPEKKKKTKGPTKKSQGLPSDISPALAKQLLDQLGVKDED